MSETNNDSGAAEQRPVDSVLQEVRKGGVGHNPVADVWVVGPVSNFTVVSGAELSAPTSAPQPSPTPAAPPTESTGADSAGE
jgi:hypothetical protein